MTKLEVDVKTSEIESAIAFAPFDKAYKSLRQKRYDLISLATQAQLRIQEGPESPISTNENFVLNDVIYIPGERARLTLNSSPIALNPREATQAHREKREFYLEDIEQFLENSVEFPDKDIEIPTNRLGNEELIVKAFCGEKQAKAYGDFLSQAKIEEMPVVVIDKSYVDKQEKPFARKMWFIGLGCNRSGFAGDRHSLYHDLNPSYKIGGVRGVREVVSAPGEIYTPETIEQALRDMKLEELSSELIKKLRAK